MRKLVIDLKDKYPGIRSRLLKIGGRLGSLLLWIGVWQLAAIAAGHEVLVPKPLTVWRVLVGLAAQPDFWNEIAGSLSRVLLGFALAMLAGCVLGCLMHVSKAARILLETPLAVVKATPVPSFIILALIWIKSGMVPVFISFLMVLPTVCLSIAQGLSQVDSKLVEMMHIYNVKPLRRVGMLYAPSLVPYAMAAAKSGLALAWKAGISAEVIGRTVDSIGRQLYESKLYLETERLFAYTLAVILLSRLLEVTLIAAAERAAARYLAIAGEGHDVQA